MRALLVSILLFPICLAAQTQSKEDEISPAFKSAAVDALSCVRALDDVATKSASLFAAQNTRCEELISKLDLLSTTKAEGKVHGSLAMARVQLKMGRNWWDLNRFDDAKKCFAEARARESDAEDQIKGKRDESSDAKK
jgi:hypothetical protein